ncbi:MAG: peptidoglycan-binding protein [Candidatus Wildermuthbacteria bacterium]|nr:peptidoglycan-binding protein [Candidatus Wildermuthbacteria bacterium]
MRKKNLSLAICVGIILFLFPFAAFASDILGQGATFFVDPEFDIAGRKQILATLRYETLRLYFYAEDDWWSGLTDSSKSEVMNALGRLDAEFANTIYPSVTKLFGTEQKPGIDRDEHITVLIQQTSETRNGYTRIADGYSKFEAATSNEREMVYLNSSMIVKETAPSYLAHEFFHLVYLNQKELKYGVSDDLWIQEGLAEFAASLAEYDSNEKKYLGERVKDFIANPRDSLTEWRGLPIDYGIGNIFFQYVADRYGPNVLADIVKSRQIGIAAFNDALQKNSISKTYDQVFTDWTIAVFLNNCSYGKEYCFLEESLEKVRVMPLISFLPAFGTSELTVTSLTKNWSGNWQKISGGKGELTLEFNGNPAAQYILPYLLQKNSGEYELYFAKLSRIQASKIIVPEFGKDYTSMILIPSIQEKTEGFTNADPSYFFSWTVSVREEGQPQIPGDSQSTQELLRQIAELQAKVAELQRILDAAQNPNPISCVNFSRNLEYGLRNNQEVRCLQEFLKNQGADIYPEGLVTGYFGPLTKAAVIRFQEKYKAEILAPIGYTFGTGYVGQMTRQKINQILDKR